MTVAIETPRAESIGNGSTTYFAHAFTVLDSDDLVVEIESGDVITLQTLGVHYTVDGIGSSSGAITFTTAPASGVIVRRYRQSALQRTTDYQENGDLPASTLNGDFDRLWLTLQEIIGGIEGLASAVRAPNGEQIPALPPVASRIDKLLSFNSVGAPIAVAPVSGSATALAVDLASSTGAGLIGLGQSTVSAVLGDVVNVLTAGASPSATAAANVTAINVALSSAAVLGVPVYFPPSADPYNVNDEFTVPDGVDVIGNGRQSWVRQTVAGKNIFIPGNHCTISRLRMEFGVDGNNLDFTKQNAVFGNGKIGVAVTDCFIRLRSICSGVQLRDCYQPRITGNVIWGGVWDGSTGGPAAAASDIVCYSIVGGGRAQIAGNFCLSNNSQGIYFSALGKDADAVVAANLCIAMDAAFGYAAAGGARRHGIVANYNGSSQTRISLSGNICTNTRWTGIYIQGSGASTGGRILASGNVIWRVGYETGNPLSGGIFVTSNGGEAITGNIISDFQGDLAATGGVTVTCPAVGGVAGTTVSDNTILGSLASGVAVVNRALGVAVTDNTILNSTGSDVTVSLTAGDTAVGGITVDDNTIWRSNTASPSISFDQQSGLVRSSVSNNKIRGTSDAISSTNVGVSLSGQAPVVDVLENKIDKFGYGINFANYFAGSTRYFEQVGLERNRISNCSQGIGASALDAHTVVPAVDNVFSNCTARLGTGTIGGSACLYIARRLGLKLEIAVTAIPTVGTFVVGDRAINQAGTIGQPKAWQCTTAGSPGTMTSEGNL